MTNHPNRSKIVTVALTLGHELNDARVRGKVYDAQTGDIWCREELLRRFDAGEIRSLKAIRHAKHPSYGRSEVMSDGKSRPWDVEDRSAEMSRQEICDLFDAAAKIAA